MKTIVITQPFFFPWIGLFEQLRLADIFVHYDDVQFSKGGFINRVQIKTPNGFKWLSVPLKNVKLGQNINEVEIDNKVDWRSSHFDFLKQMYVKAPFKDEMLEIVNKIYWKLPFTNLANLLINGIEQISIYFGLYQKTIFERCSDLNIKGKSTERVLSIVKYFNANKYITAMGALKYFDFDLFERSNISVDFINYKKLPYNQLYGDFNPYVSILDLIANQGKDGIKYICSDTMHWKDFIKTDSAKQYLKRSEKSIN